MSRRAAVPELLERFARLPAGRVDLVVSRCKLKEEQLVRIVQTGTATPREAGELQAGLAQAEQDLAKLPGRVAQWKANGSSGVGKQTVGDSAPGVGGLVARARRKGPGTAERVPAAPVALESVAGKKQRRPRPSPTEAFKATLGVADDFHQALAAALGLLSALPADRRRSVARFVGEQLNVILEVRS